MSLAAASLDGAAPQEAERLPPIAPAALEPLLGQRGRSGTVWRGGNPSKPRDPFKTPREWALVAEEMMRDARVRQAMEARLAGLRAAGWTVTESTAPDPRSAEYARTVRRVLGLDGEPGMMERPFGAVIDEAAIFVYFGAWVGEVIWGYDVASGLSYVRDIEGRLLSSIESFGDEGQLGPITQRVAGAVREPEPMPGHKVLVFTAGQVGHDWAGLGIARTAWGPWQEKCQLVDSMMAGFKGGGARPEVVCDPALLGADGQSTADRIIEQARDLAAQTFEGAQVVSVSITSDGRDALRTIYHPDSYDPSRALSAIDSAVREIYASAGVEAHLMGMQADTAGNRSLGEVHAAGLRQAQIRDADTIAQALNGRWRAGGGLVGAIIEMNHADPDPRCFPTIAHTGLEVDAFAELLPELPGLIDAGLVPPLPALLDRILALVDVPAPSGAEAQAAWDDWQARKLGVTPGGGAFAALRRRQVAGG